MMTALNPKTSVIVKNVGEDDIPPRSVVVVTGAVITPATSTQESMLHVTVKKYEGEDGTFVVTGSAVIKADEFGSAFYDQFIYVAVEPSESPIEGAEYGPEFGEFYVTTNGTGFIAVGHDDNDATPRMSLFYRAPVTDGGGGGVGDCQCCLCTNCIDESKAIVFGCDACPDGAAGEYDTDIGVWTEFPELSGALRFLLGIQTTECDGPSSSGVIPPGSGCQWSSCVIAVTRPDPSLTSMSSSGATVTGYYQWIFDSEHVDGPGYYLHFLSGTDLVYDWV